MGAATGGRISDPAWAGCGAGLNGLAGLLIVWVGIVLVNLIYGWTHRQH